MYPHCTVPIRLLYAFYKYFDFENFADDALDFLMLYLPPYFIAHIQKNLIIILSNTKLS